MQLLIMVLNEVELLDPLLEKMLEHGLKGATILDSTGMARELSKSDDAPMFSTLRILFDPERKQSKTIFMALKDDEVEPTKEIIHSVVGDLSKPDTAVLFTIPIIDSEGIGTK